MAEEAQPTSPHDRKFGSQFYQKPDFFLNTEAPDWEAHPIQTITQATMLASLANETLTQAAVNTQRNPEMGLPTVEELQTSMGSEAVHQSTEAINILAQHHVEGGNVTGVPAFDDQMGRVNEVIQARDLGLQGASQWWAGNIINMGGGGHVPMGEDLTGRELESGSTPVIPDPNINDPNAEHDPWLSYPDTDAEGLLAFGLEHGAPSMTSGTEPVNFIANMLEPISSMDFGPEDFEDRENN